MRALFAHDTRFFLKNQKYYSTAINCTVLNRYLNIFDTLVVCGRQPKRINGKKIGSLASTEKVVFDNISDKNAIYIWFDKNDRDHIKKLVQEVDFVIARLDSMIGFLAVKYAKNYNVPYAIELCTDPWDCYVNYGLKGKALAPWITYMTKKEVKEASNVIYVTNKYLQEKYPSSHNTIAISNVECSPIQEIADRKKEKYKKREQSQVLVLGTAGALLPFKGQRFVIEAMHLLKKQGFNNIYYRLAGNGNDLESLKKLIKRYGLDNRVEFCGTLNSDEMKEFYDSLDVYIQPSLQEGLPRTVIEAMSRGLCCLGSRTAGIPELLPDNRIFAKKDSKSLARMIKELSKEELIEDSIRNFNESKMYDKVVLDQRRTGYFSNIIHQLSDISN